MDLAIELSGVNYDIRTGFLLKKKSIVKDFSLGIAKGVSMGLIGPNGAGKTTTIKLCAGILRPTTGAALLHGKPVWKSGERKKVGLLTENQ